MWDLLLVGAGLFFLGVVPEAIKQAGGGDSLSNYIIHLAMVFIILLIFFHKLELGATIIGTFAVFFYQKWRKLC